MIDAALAPEAIDDELQARLTQMQVRVERNLAFSARLHGESRKLAESLVGHGFPRWFVVRGRVGRREVRASWSRGRLVISHPLADRTRCVVALGDEFEAEGCGRVRASLDEPLPAMLTVIRACDAVAEVTFGPLAAAASGPNGAATGECG